MKKYLSVFMLLTRSTIYRFAPLLAAAAAVEAALLMLVGAPDASGLEGAVNASGLGIVSALLFVLWTVQLCLTCGDNGAKSSYTLCRLRVSEREVFFVQAIHNCLSYTLLWAFCAALSYGLCLLYGAAVSPLGTQDIMLCFYRDDLFHALLPMGDAGAWARLAGAIISLGICSAAYPLDRLDRGRGAMSVTACAVIQLLSFSGNIGNVSGMDYLLTVVCLLIAGGVTASVISGVNSDEDA